MGILQVISLVISWSIVITIQYDTNGYIVYCPCMGRFGNQADHFLGVLGFSKKVNRTLILPPWVEFRYGEATSRQVPFDTYFKVEPLSTYHRIITMELFMSSIALIIWPESKRISFCYMKRNGDQENSCNAKSGNPFGPFWDTYGIDFVGSEFYGPLNYDADSDSMVEKWKVQYPPENWPVLAFAGAPAAFPVQQKNVALQKYMSWSDDIENKAKSFIKKHLYGGGFLGIHLRNGQDWTRACQHVQDSPTLFAAPQCVGYRNEKGPLTMAMCLPQKKEIIRQVKRALRKINDIKSIFVASDSNHMIEELNASLHSMDITVIKYPISHPHVDLAMLGRANYFIGNCVSSFSAFVKRERDVRGLPSEFWSFPTRKKPKHEEL